MNAKLKLVIELEYEAKPEHYSDGEDVSPEDMAKIDQENFDSDIGHIMEMLGNEDIVVKVEVVN